LTIAEDILKKTQP